MINSLFAGMAPGVRDVGPNVNSLLSQDGPTQPGIEYGDAIARILGSTVADPLARMQFEYRATASPRLFSADAHEAAARRLSVPDLLPDHVGSAGWAMAFLPAKTNDAALAGTGWLEMPTSVPAMFSMVHNNWGS